MYDCIIVGSGPAGASAAYHLAKRGRSVLILERATLPRSKPCGGGVSPQIAEWFDFDFSPVISVKARHMRYTWQMQDEVEAEVPESYALWMVRRDQFDYFLVQQAQRQGAELWEGTKATGVEFASDRWIVANSRSPVRGRYLIAADGATGNMAKWLGFQRRYRLAAALEAEPRLAVPEVPVIHLELGLLKNGYAWNFPKADGYSIGGGVFRTGQQRRQDLKQPLADYAHLFAVDTHQVKHYGHPICIWDGDQPLHTQNALLVGEAACVVDPFTAEGIRPSIFSGVQAATAIDAALAGDGEALADYSRVMADTWGSDMRWAKRLSQTFYRVPKLAYELGVKRSSGPLAFARLFCGDISYGEVAQKALRRLVHFS